MGEVILESLEISVRTVRPGTRVGEISVLPTNRPQQEGTVVRVVSAIEIYLGYLGSLASGTIHREWRGMRSWSRSGDVRLGELYFPHPCRDETAA